MIWRFIHKTALTLVGRNTRLSMRTIYALMWLSMRSISFHVPQAKEQMLLYKFPAQASLMVDPASPRAPNDRYSYLMVVSYADLL
jgi:hypothetical protein